MLETIWKVFKAFLGDNCQEFGYKSTDANNDVDLEQQAKILKTMNIGAE